MHLDIFHMPLTVMVYAPPSNIITLPVVADRHSLEIIKYSNRGYYGQIRLLGGHSQSQNVPQFLYTDTTNTF